MRLPFPTLKLVKKPFCCQGKPSLNGLQALEVFKLIVNSLGMTRLKMIVMLNNQVNSFLGIEKQNIWVVTLVLMFWIGFWKCFTASLHCAFWKQPCSFCSKQHRRKAFIMKCFAASLHCAFLETTLQFLFQTAISKLHINTYPALFASLIYIHHHHIDICCQTYMFFKCSKHYHEQFISFY